MQGGSLLIFSCCAIKQGHQLDSGSVHYRCFCAYAGMCVCVWVCVCVWCTNSELCCMLINIYCFLWHSHLETALIKSNQKANMSDDLATFIKWAQAYSVHFFQQYWSSLCNMSLPFSHGLTCWPLQLSDSLLSDLNKKLWPAEQNHSTSSGFWLWVH